MKKLVLSIFTLFLFAASTFAQEDVNAAYKAANKAYKSWQTETNNDKRSELLTKAADNMDIALTNTAAFDEKTITKVLLLAGQIYNEVSSLDVIAKSLNPDAKMKRPDAALKAFTSLKAGMEGAEKKYFKSDALDQLRFTSTHLSNTGLLLFKDGDYEGAYANYAAVSECHELFKANGKKPVLDEDAKMNDHLYMTALSALQAKKIDEAEAGFTKLKNNKYEDPAVYNALVTIAMDKKDNAKAEALLAEGRQKFPEDNSLMVTELNHYLSNNRFDELVGKLESAIAADPENVSYYSALGNTYDNLFQREMEAKNLVKAEEHFNKAMSYYTQALNRDPNYFFAIYNTGVLYVNKANLLIEELKVLENKGDYSKSALAKMEEKKTAINSEFDKSLPFFQRAESIEPNDVNTLSALKEIYARKEDFELSKEFGRRMKVIEEGNKNETSYFKSK
jgi:tetratricopeptide (TPR) repeat protein